MIISFDLDDTLVCGENTFDTENQNLLQRLTGTEKIRKGSVGLFKELRSRGHNIYIYTTSFRSALKVKLTFMSYGVTVDRVINQQCHDRELRERKTRCSKFPPAFGIDIHVDDSQGLKIEGDKFNFRTIIVGDKDSNWTEKVLNGVASLRDSSPHQSHRFPRL